MITHVPGFQSFFLRHFVLAKLGTCSIRVKYKVVRPFVHSGEMEYCKVRNISETIFSELIRFSIIADRNIRV